MRVLPLTIVIISLFAFSQQFRIKQALSENLIGLAQQAEGGDNPTPETPPVDPSQTPNASGDPNAQAPPAGDQTQPPNGTVDGTQPAQPPADQNNGQQPND